MMTFLLSAGAMIIVLLLIICIPLLTIRKKDTGCLLYTSDAADD